MLLRVANLSLPNSTESQMIRPWILAVSLITSTLVHADTSKFQKKGYIQNDSGGKCWYAQTVDPKSKYFHGNLAGAVGTIRFDDPACMKDSGIGLGTNKMMINNTISRWYSHADAAFQTRKQELYPSSLMQKKGSCIQSKKYAPIGITVDYILAGSSITKVLHGTALQGCSK